MIDHECLQQFAGAGSQPAFATLVGRHIDLVYSAALRQVRSPQLAEEVAQSVFLDLARHASKLSPNVSLAAWLYVVTRRTAVDVIRRESRRQARERTAADIAAMKTPPHAWSHVERSLDDAMETLNDAERTAIVLRYFENLTLREVGDALGISEDTAQKRVSRAVEQLRDFFQRRGVAVSAAALATDLSAQAVQMAPAGLGTVISKATALVGATASTAALETARVVAMTTLQKSAALVAFVALAGAGLVQGHLIARYADEAVGLRVQNDRVATEIRDLRLARAATAAKLEAVERRIDARFAAAIPVAPADAALESQMREWLVQVDRLKQFLVQRPEWDIPELKLLTEENWFNAAGGGRFESEEQFRRATASLRDRAAGLAGNRIMKALNAYLRAHDGVLPNSPAELAPYFDSPMAPEILARYEMLQTGKASEVPRGETTRMLAPKAPADVEFDANFYVGTNGYGNNGIAMHTNVREAQRQFAKTHNGLRATTAEQLMPLLKWPVSAAALQKYLDPQPPSGRP
ncbi:MAG: sigma-70 family RNA polymerase sigma factor [Verrucomicrobia bacterium]|nr:sigma-70 family RNA polymerase sigma factor [Verrucomicrobiota bacterium]